MFSSHLANPHRQRASKAMHKDQHQSKTLTSLETGLSPAAAPPVERSGRRSVVKSTPPTPRQEATASTGQSRRSGYAAGTSDAPPYDDGRGYNTPLTNVKRHKAFVEPMLTAPIERHRQFDAKRRETTLTEECRPAPRSSRAVFPSAAKTEKSLLHYTEAKDAAASPSRTTAATTPRSVRVVAPHCVAPQIEEDARGSRVKMFAYSHGFGPANPPFDTKAQGRYYPDPPVCGEHEAPHIGRRLIASTKSHCFGDQPTATEKHFGRRHNESQQFSGCGAKGCDFSDIPEQPAKGRGQPMAATARYQQVNIFSGEDTSRPLSARGKGGLHHQHPQNRSTALW
eukprot:PhM_4_TR4026/c0_g1_i1/m.47032